MPDIKIRKTLVERLGRKKVRGYKYLLIAVPFLLYVFAMNYVPLIGWIYTVFDYKMGQQFLDFGNLTFIGLDNFRKLFAEHSEVLRVLRNTLVMSALTLLATPFPVLFAIMINELKGKYFKKFVQTATTLPNFISWIIIYSIMFSLFSNDGLLTTLFRGLSGNRDSTVTLLTNPGSAKLFMVMTNIWKTVGYNSIIFFAAVTGIDSQLYDAAAVDGAGRWQKIVHITIPGILPTFITLLIISVGAILNNGFEQYYVFVNPMIQKNIEVLDYYVYRIGMLNNDIPASTAVSMIKTFISVILVFSVNKLSKRALGQSIL